MYLSNLITRNNIATVSSIIPPGPAHGVIRVLLQVAEDEGVDRIDAAQGRRLLQIAQPRGLRLRLDKRMDAWKVGSIVAKQSHTKPIRASAAQINRENKKNHATSKTRTFHTFHQFSVRQKCTLSRTPCKG